MDTDIKLTKYLTSDSALSLSYELKEIINKRIMKHIMQFDTTIHDEKSLEISS